MCATPDDLADEAIDRVARRLAEGERIESPEVMHYVYGVARNVLLEHWKSERRAATATAVPTPARNPAEADVQRERSELELDCFAECLNRQPEPERRLLLRYYEHTGHDKIKARSTIAQQLGIPINALRIRIHRIKADLLRCMDRCTHGKT